MAGKPYYVLTNEDGDVWVGDVHRHPDAWAVCLCKSEVDAEAVAQGLRRDAGKDTITAKDFKKLLMTQTGDTPVFIQVGVYLHPVARLSVGDTQVKVTAQASAWCEQADGSVALYDPHWHEQVHNYLVCVSYGEYEDEYESKYVVRAHSRYDAASAVRAALGDTDDGWVVGSIKLPDVAAGEVVRLYDDIFDNEALNGVSPDTVDVILRRSGKMNDTLLVYGDVDGTTLCIKATASSKYAIKLICV
jgi:hypothetical protein